MAQKWNSKQESSENLDKYPTNTLSNERFKKAV